MGIDTRFVYPPWEPFRHLFGEWLYKHLRENKPGKELGDQLLYWAMDVLREALYPSLVNWRTGERVED